MTLPTNYADGNTLHGTDVDTWTTAINALTNNDVPGLTTTNTSSLPITLNNASTGMQVFTGSTAGTLTMPTTSVVAGATWQINNQSTANITVNASGGTTIDIVPPNNYGIFVAQQATPTLATHWLDNLIVAPTLTTTNTSSLPITLNVGSARIQVFTGSTAGTLTLPTTSIVAGGQFAVINQSSAVITVNSSGANLVLTMGGSTSAVFTARIATPTAAADWDPQYGGVVVASGTVLTGPAVSGTIVAPPAAVNTLTTNVNPTTASTKILSSNSIPISTLAAGSTFRIKAQGVQASVTSSVTMSLYMGTGGLTTDVLISTATATVSSSVGISFDGLVTVRTTGAAGTVIGACRILPAVGSIGESVTTLTQSVNTTVANFVTVAQTNSTNTSTVTMAVISWAGA